MDKENKIFFNQNLNRVVLKKNKKNYSVYFYKKKKNNIINFKSCELNISFGIENYNYKKIVNLEFDKLKESNIVHNTLSQIYLIEDFFENINKYKEDMKYTLPKSLFSDINEKEFVSNIKLKDNHNPLFRTHLKIKKKNTLVNLLIKMKKKFFINF